MVSKYYNKRGALPSCTQNGKTVADPEGVQGVCLSPPPCFKYPMKINNLVSETKFFHFHGRFKKKREKSSKGNPPHLYTYEIPFPEIPDPPLQKLWSLANRSKQWLNYIHQILFVLKMLSAYYVCCMNLNGHLGKNTMKPDQIAHKEQSDLDP